jgi:hypothetical protein
MIENNFPDYIYDSALLEDNEVQSIVDEILLAPFYMDPSIKAAKDGIVGITGDKFSDRLIMVAGSNDPDHHDPLRKAAKYAVDKFCDKYGFDLLDIYRTRTNLTFMSKDLRPTMPHVDLRGKYKHYVFIIYLNDCDGDTVMFDLKMDGTIHTQDELVEKKRFSPAKGAVAVFDSDYFHTWHHPAESDYRLSMVVNISIRKKQNDSNGV